MESIIFRLEPPPTLNDSRRETAASSILTNSPRQLRVDGFVANTSRDRPHDYYQNVSFATTEQSET